MPLPAFVVLPPASAKRRSAARSTPSVLRAAAAADEGLLAAPPPASPPPIAGAAEPSSDSDPRAPLAIEDLDRIFGLDGGAQPQPVQYGLGAFGEPRQPAEPPADASRPDLSGGESPMPSAADGGSRSYSSRRAFRWPRAAGRPGHARWASLAGHETLHEPLPEEPPESGELRLSIVYDGQDPEHYLFPDPPFHYQYALDHQHRQHQSRSHGSRHSHQAHAGGDCRVGSHGSDGAPREDELTSSAASISSSKSKMSWFSPRQPWFRSSKTKSVFNTIGQPKSRQPSLTGSTLSSASPVSTSSSEFPRDTLPHSAAHCQCQCHGHAHHQHHHHHHHHHHLHPQEAHASYHHYSLPHHSPHRQLPHDQHATGTSCSQCHAQCHANEGLAPDVWIRTRQGWLPLELLQMPTGAGFFGALAPSGTLRARSSGCDHGPGVSSCLKCGADDFVGFNGRASVLDIMESLMTESTARPAEHHRHHTAPPSLRSRHGFSGPVLPIQTQHESLSSMLSETPVAQTPVGIPVPNHVAGHAATLR
ncbi:hypothetical protein HK105_204687 [Polyrhizophydium stewartii]|uniref:Uncharacterized protein n=1 Tax=Polyrhizophydium stewartii TaxID=2732419 RepID=A0ABR4N892_9FUNG